MPNLNHLNSSLPHQVARQAPDEALPGYAHIPELCRRFGLSRSGIYRAAAAGHVRLVKLAGRTLGDVASFREYMANLPAAEIRQAEAA